MFTGDTTAPTGASITINVNVPGKVVLNLEGVHFFPYLVTPGVGPFDAIDVLAGEDVTIKNGVFGNDGFGFLNGISVNPNGAASKTARTQILRNKEH